MSSELRLSITYTNGRPMYFTSETNEGVEVGGSASLAPVDLILRVDEWLSDNQEYDRTSPLLRALLS